MKRINESIISEVLHNFEKIKDNKGKNLEMISLFVSQGEEVFKHSFNKDINQVDIRSVSKTFLCVALGIGLEEGLKINGETLTLETLIWRFFENKVKLENRKNLPYLKKIKLKHLLTHTMGFPKGLMFSNDIKDKDPDDFLNYIFNTEIIYEPGSKHVYSNVGPYLISVLIQDELNINFSDWANEKLLMRMDINDYEWQNYGKYCAGCTGLKISHEDLHKLGELFINDGIYNGQRIVSSKWLKEITTIQILTPEKYDTNRALPKYGYGLLMVICKNGIYYGDGNKGQYLIMIPKNNIIISTLANQDDNKPITVAMKPILKLND